MQSLSPQHTQIKFQRRLISHSAEFNCFWRQFIRGILSRRDGANFHIFDRPHCLRRKHTHKFLHFLAFPFQRTERIPRQNIWLVRSTVSVLFKHTTQKIHWGTPQKRNLPRAAGWVNICASVSSRLMQRHIFTNEWTGISHRARVQMFCRCHFAFAQKMRAPCRR